MRSRVVADQMQVVARGCCDAEGLLHESVRLVSITIVSIVTSHLKIRVAATSTIRCLSSSCCCEWGRESVASPFALHFAICEEASRDSAGAPRFAICPSPHPCFSPIRDSRVSLIIPLREDVKRTETNPGTISIHSYRIKPKIRIAGYRIIHTHPRRIPNRI